MMPTIKILQLYPDDMNIYGDWGNVLTLQKRLNWRGVKVEIINYNLGDDFNQRSQGVDIIVGGGGQDSGQTKIHADLIKIGPQLQQLADRDLPMLVICGMYQLFGKEFVTKSDQRLKGVGIFDATTRASDHRLIGNITLNSDDFGLVVGYENHSGQTFLGDMTQPLGRVIRGAGNNQNDGFEGARYRNVIGSYLHGSLLPNNPQIADFLIEQALKNRQIDQPLTTLEIDKIAQKVRQSATKRSR